MSRVQQDAGFRQKEVQHLLNWVQAGESASIVGMSGVGKSNLFNHLLDQRIQQNILDENAGKTIFVRTNFHYAPNCSNRTVYSLILEQLETLGESGPKPWLTPEHNESISAQHEALLDAGNDELKVQRYFKKAIHILIGQSDRHLVLLFDQFDEIYRNAASSLFANLRGLREAYKYRISFMVFTRDILPNLVPMDPGREEFFELLASNVMGLGPYNSDDAHAMLGRISRRDSLPLDDMLAEKVNDLSGGHAGLLRAVYLAVARDNLQLPTQADESVDTLLMVPSVELECDKVWASFSIDEQRAIAFLAHDVENTAVFPNILRRLELKGVLHNGILFSPLLAAYAREQEALWDRPLYLDEQTRQVWVLGKPSKPLTKLDYDLFRALYIQPSTLLTRDELVDAGWPDAQGGVSNEALNAAMSRLRKKIEPDPSEPRFIKVSHNQGYTLLLSESDLGDEA